MKKKILLILLLIAGILTFAGCQANDGNAGSATTINTTTIDGDTFISADIANNKLTVLNVWGTWCYPCVMELPELAKVNEKFKDKNVVVIGVLQDSINESGEVDEAVIKSAKKSLKDANATYTNLIPDQYLQTEFIGKMQYFPTTFFLNSKGEVIKTETGAHTFEEWSKIINETLDELEK